MRIVMLVINDWKFDSRVSREAEALAERGHAVHVVCRRDGAATVEHHNGVEYHCVPRTLNARPFAAIAAHMRMMSLNAQWMVTGPRRLLASTAVTEHLLTLAPAALASVLLALGVVAWHVVFRRIFALRPLRSSMRCSWLIQQGKTAVGSTLRYVMQPFQYLNDSVHSCLSVAVALQPDVIHAHDLVTLSTGMLAARRVGARLVYDSHELERHTNYHTLNMWTKRWIRRYETDLAARCDTVITVSDSIAEWLEREYRIARPVVVRNVPSTGLAAPVLAARDTVRRRIGLSSEIPLMVYVGSITVDRGLELCVRALQHLPDVHFAAVGPRYQATEEAMKCAAAEIGSLDRLHLVDAVPPTDVMNFISDADCSVMAIQNVCLSYYFCFPNKLLESVLSGLPVVAADLYELRRFVVQYNVGVVVDERDPRSIADGVREVLRHRPRYRPSADTMRAILDVYGWDTQRQRLVDLYCSLDRSQQQAAILAYEPERLRN
jgi:glycosyltransferase involved in cell wall biosynthesis